ncbi:conserved hypothetical protein [Verticillium alfalfae VaMs.102]|uniref:lytic cellulose monooxygenase (C4-dehydrogenating) n=1 Tax=Verticillium alfalfae (strain VaMs.102 / ATCC MYA-4576 / FGSC 10136) TaxID=526221 RepID=C9SRK2_VERA1|nr:conserved hypothetical protein [Verticillium alfalfae VaMs.102]EEY21417.1 conserved hypothetical protein [Verticillium alfalfae VaMs.102]
MKTFALLPLLSSGVLAHYFFPNTVVDGVQSAEWEFIRETNNNPGAEPVEDLSSTFLRSTAWAIQVPFSSTWRACLTGRTSRPGTPSVTYGSRLTSTVTSAAHIPAFETEMREISTTIPKTLPNGDYLLRAEHIGLHAYGTPQFYIACAQVEVSGGGNGTPGPLVAFPGEYSKEDPGLAVNIYAASQPYEYPGPEVWSG